MEILRAVTVVAVLSVPLAIMVKQVWGTFGPKRKLRKWQKRNI